MVIAVSLLECIRSNYHGYISFRNFHPHLLEEMPAMGIRNVHIAARHHRRVTWDLQNANTPSPLPCSYLFSPFVIRHTLLGHFGKTQIHVG